MTENATGLALPVQGVGAGYLVRRVVDQHPAQWALSCTSHINSSLMPKLDNYLRSSRRRAGLSQDEMAYLLGVHTGTIASRYERFKRKPALETALAYEAIFRTPVRELFAGIYAKAEHSAARRARLLRKRLLADGQYAEAKLKLLNALAPDKPTTKP